MNKGVKPLRIAVVFTLGISAGQWQKAGILKREMAIYKRLSRRDARIHLLSYGGANDQRISRNLPKNLSIHPLNDGPIEETGGPICAIKGSVVLPLKHREILKKCDLIKTNQMMGAWSAIAMKALYGGKLLMRSGYTWSRIVERETENPIKRALASVTERVAYGYADGIITTIEDDMDYILNRYSPRCPTAVIPNYVDCDVFRPMKDKRKRGTICFVGRLDPIKNLDALIRSLAGLPYSLTIIGDGIEEDHLRKLATSLEVDVRFLGTVPNEKLPELINQHQAFVIPSKYEGMPKVLLESMACGMPILGSDVNNINKIIKDGGNGIISRTDPSSLREGILKLMENNDLGDRLGEAARRDALEKYSLDSVAEREVEFYKLVLGRDCSWTG